MNQPFGLPPMQDPRKPKEETSEADEETLKNLAEEALGGDEAPIDTSELSGEIAELNDKLMRSVAEMENVRKRAERDVAEAKQFAITGFARGLVSVLENLQRATGSIGDELRAENEQVKNLAEGVEMTLRELLTVFERFGIRRLDPMGEKFDHNFHQAMQQIEDDSVEPGTVLQVLQAGYTIQDRLLQPALVNVAKASGGAASESVNTEA